MNSVYHEIFLTTLHCHAKSLPRDSWRHFQLIADDAYSGLRFPLPEDKRLVVAHLNASLSNAIDRFKQVRKQ